MTTETTGSHWERVAKINRDGAVAIGAGAIVLGAMVKHPETAGFGIAAMAAGAAFEGVRLLLGGPTESDMPQSQ